MRVRPAAAAPRPALRPRRPPPTRPAGTRRHLDDAAHRHRPRLDRLDERHHAPATSSTTSTASAAPAPATESSAASLPIGAVVGPAGLATLPYTLTFKGGFFDIANFIGGVDNLVQPTASGVRVTPDGRLFTVDGFALNGGLPGSSPRLKANFAVTTYATPADPGPDARRHARAARRRQSQARSQAQPASAVVAK